MRLSSVSILLAASTFCQAVPFDSLPADGVNEIVPRASSSESDCVFQYYDQKIDHFGKYNGTFKQKYNLVTEFFKPGGPILFFQGEEGTSLDCVTSTIYYSWAQELGGLAVSLEHRYFGSSAPFGAKDPITQHNEFQYLTLDNVMADAATFVEYLRKTFKGAGNSKAIVASGSYGGFLATVFRQNYPDVFYGAIASAPPVEGLLDNASDPYRYNWNIWLNNVYQDRSALASSKIKNAFKALEKRFSSENISTLKEELGLCSAPAKSDYTTLRLLIYSVYSISAELNYAAIRPGRSTTVLPLKKVINIAIRQDDPIQILNETLSMWYGLSPGVGLQCINVTESVAQGPVPLIEANIFNYITCKYFPLGSAGVIPNGTIFPAYDGGSFVPYCDIEYNITTPSVSDLRNKYKYTAEDLRKSTRIIWSLGQYDPTSGLSPNQPGINAPVMSTDRNVSRILYTSDMAHREDLFAPDPSDRDSVIGARNIELESIKGWLGWYDLS